MLLPRLRSGRAAWTTKTSETPLTTMAWASSAASRSSEGRPGPSQRHGRSGRGGRFFAATPSMRRRAPSGVPTSARMAYARPPRGLGVNLGAGGLAAASSALYPRKMSSPLPAKRLAIAKPMPFTPPVNPAPTWWPPPFRAGTEGSAGTCLTFLYDKNGAGTIENQASFGARQVDPFAHPSRPLASRGLSTPSLLARRTAGDLRNGCANADLAVQRHCMTKMFVKTVDELNRRAYRLWDERQFALGFASPGEDEEQGSDSSDLRKMMRQGKGRRRFHLWERRPRTFELRQAKTSKNFRREMMKARGWIVAAAALLATTAMTGSAFADAKSKGNLKVAIFSVNAASPTIHAAD